MDTSTGRQRPFPALAIVAVLLIVCVFPGQRLISPLVPAFSGIATIAPSLIIFDIPVQLPVSIDLLLVSALFLTVYLIVILLYPGRRGISLFREIAGRIGALLSGAFIILCFAAAGGLIVSLAQDRFPRSVKNGVESLGINADVHLPYTGAQIVHLHGNILVVLCLAIGVAISIGKINRDPQTRKTKPLTKEQRISPYRRMLQEKRSQVKPPPPVKAKSRPPGVPIEPPAPPSAVRAKSRPATVKQSNTYCSHEPLSSLQPEAVNYRPLN